MLFRSEVGRAIIWLSKFLNDLPGKLPEFNHVLMVLNGFLQDQFWLVHLPPPLSAHRIGMVPPAEDTFIRTRQAWGGFHAAVALNAVECVFVATSSPPQHRLWQAGNTPSFEWDNRNLTARHCFSICTL